MARIVIRNPNQNVVLVDDTYENLTLRNKGILTASRINNVVTGAGIRTLSFSVSDGLPPILAIRPVHTGASFQGIASSSQILYSSFSNGLSTFNLILNLSGGAGDLILDVEWFLFDRAAVTTNGIGPIILRNRQNGRVTFDSGLKYMRVRDFFSGNSIIASNRSYPSNRKYAATPCKINYITDNQYFDDAGGWVGNESTTWGSFRFESNNFIGAGYVNTRFYPGPPATPKPDDVYYESLSYSYLAIDVTGY